MSLIKETVAIELSNIADHPSHAKLYKLLIAQIEKDLNMCGIDWQNAFETTPQSLFEELSAIISQLFQNDYKNDIRMFLYRVDVSEKRLRQIDQLTVEEIVNLVLHREIEKIWMKYKYSNL